MNKLNIITIVLFAGVSHSAEPQHEMRRAVADPLVGDWQGNGSYVAQVVRADAGGYELNVLKQFDVENNLVAGLKGSPAEVSGEEWKGDLTADHIMMSKGAESFELRHVNGPSPTLNAKPPKGAVILFDGSNLDAWAKKKGKDWLVEDGPAKWKILGGGILEVVPNSDCIITHQKFGDCKVHVEFRTLGAPSNSGVFLETRYEANINETYGRRDGTPNAGFDNCTPKSATPKIRASRPPLEWQTFDIDFRAPRFDAAGKKTQDARATVLFNGVKIYDQMELNVPTGAANRLGEAPTGPLMLQEHGMPVQFRNIWLVETGK